jgi:hypothetical protein
MIVRSRRTESSGNEDSILCGGPDKVPALRTVNRLMVREPALGWEPSRCCGWPGPPNAHVAAETILTHAVGIGQIAARHVGAAVIALDPFDAQAE